MKNAPRSLARLWTPLALISAFSCGVPTHVSALVQPGPLDVSGEINGAPFRIIVPGTWNGTLLVFQRGFTDKADHPGEIDNRNPTITPPNSPIRDSLLARGYALSGSARKTNGYSVEDGLDDVVALLSYFKENVAMPTTSILWGASMGGLITLETAERNGSFDGFLALNPLAAGAPRLLDQMLVVRLAYDVTFGMPSSWGSVADVRDDLDFETEVLPTVSLQASVPANFGLFEFIRLVAGFPGTGITPPSGYYPGALINSGQPLFIATEAEAEVERRVGGPVAQNITHNYTLTAAEKAYLASLGVDVDPLLEAMNARRNIVAAPEQRNYTEHYAALSGLIKRPVITIHPVVDQLAPVSHESAYRNSVAARGRDDLLVQVFTTGVGHGNFTATQLVTGILAVEAWAKTGVPPSPSNFSASQGFVPGFVPPAWLQPDMDVAASDLSRGGSAITAEAADDPILGPRLEMLGSQPFRGEASLRYALRSPAWVKLEVFSVDGRRVRTLVNRYEAMGSHTARFALDDGARAPLGEGVYFVRLAIGSQVQSLRIVGLN